MFETKSNMTQLYSMPSEIILEPDRRVPSPILHKRWVNNYKQWIRETLIKETFAKIIGKTDPGKRYMLFP